MRTILIAVILLAVTAGAAACGESGSGNDDPTVVTGFYPLAEAVASVATERIGVVNLTPPGVEPHDLELTTDEADRIEDADLVVLLGGGFQPALEAAAERRDGPTVQILDELAVDGGGDPHIWLDPTVMAQIVEAVTAALIEVFPGDSVSMERRSRVYREDLLALAGRYDETLDDCERRTFVTAHAAFGALAERFGLTQESIAGLSPDEEPDPRRLSQLTDLVRDRGITTVFSEELVSPEVAETLAREAGVETDVLDPLEGLSKARIAAGEGYITVMERNLERLADALGCRQP